MTVLKIDDFSDKVGQTFHLDAGEGLALDFVLQSADAKKTVDFPGKTRDPFSLLFDGPNGCLFRQGAYKMKHASGLDIDMFIVPVGKNEDGSYRYQAVFT